MRFGSICSGIEAASVAWESLQWRAQWFAEISESPSRVLATHYPEIPNLGDMTKLTTNEVFNGRAVELIVAGTPCQAFSVQGFRRGLDDPRGNLTLVLLGIVERARPRWLVWENVPGVLSSDGGRAFSSFLGGLGELGYGFACRVLDAQYFGVAQRRKRVFVVAHSGGWSRPAAVLFEREALGFPAEGSGEVSGKVIANCLEASGFRFGQSGNGFTYVLDERGLRTFTIRECERLQGFPDDYTLAAGDDKARWHTLGNSMAVPVMRWIGERINHVEMIA